MKKFLFILGIPAVSAFSISSCTMVKQQYSSGYYIHKNGNNNSQSKITQRALAVAEPVIINADHSPAVQTTGAISPEVILTNATEQVLINPAIKPVVTSSEKNTSIKSNVLVKNIPADIKPVPNVKTKVQTSLHRVKKSASAAAASGGKSQIVALLLCIFLGPLGIHRFYLGYTGMGILYLFTAGLFGIGWIIDIILLIIPNGLTPKGETSYK
ncbi:MAG: TM2 domain-containing protein [Bacteroidia bacterium]